MSQDYIPPKNTKIPFNFTEKGYSAPAATSVLLNFTAQGSFGTLKAAINVMQPYWETTHTYKKSCPKYVVGYGPGGVQIVKGRCLFGGIRDLQGIITGLDYSQTAVNLGGIVNGVLQSHYSDLNAVLRITEPADLPARIGTHPPGDLPANLDGIKFKSSGDLDAFLSGHTPRDLRAYLGTHAPEDLAADIFGDIYHGDSDVSAQIDTHFPEDLSGAVETHQASNLSIWLKGWKYGAIRDFPALIHGWQQGPDLPAYVGAHQPVDLNARMRGWARQVPTDLPAYLTGFDRTDLQGIIGAHLPSDIRGSIRAWHRGLIGDLPAIIRMWQQEELPAEIGTHPWVDMPARIFTLLPPPMRSSIRGWVREITSDVVANIYGWQDSNLSAYMSGFQPGNLGVILRAWVYEAQKDVTADIHGWQEGDLGLITKGGHSPANLGLILKGVGSGIVDLTATTHGWQEGDLGLITKGGHSPVNLRAFIDMWQRTQEDLPASIHGWLESDIPASIGAHAPGDLQAWIWGYAQGSGDLPAYIYGYAISDLAAAVATHYPVDLGARLKPGVKLIGNLQGVIHGWEWRLLGMTLAGTHYPVDLGGYINPLERRERDLAASIYGWVARNLRASLNIVLKVNLPATITLVEPADLPAYLKARYYKNLPAMVHGYADADLGAYIRRIYERFLPAKINPLTDTTKNLKARIHVYGEGEVDMSAYIRAFLHESLSAELVVKYLGRLPAYIFAIAPRDLRGDLHGWDERFLQGILNVAQYPWNLTANITATGYLRDLPAFLRPIRAEKIISDLTMSVHSWEIRNFPAYVFVDNARELWASLTPHMQASNLPAYIYPKMIRLTTIVKIPTLMARDLSAIINYPCFRTGYDNLSAFLWAKFKGDLYASIRGYIPLNEEANLGAKINYNDSYVTTDNYKFKLDILPSKYYTEDIYKLHLSVLSQRDVLGAYIKATPHYRGLAASVTGADIPTFAFPQLFKNREKVIHKTYDGQFETFEVVEMAFKSAVKEYYYSSIGNTSWAANNLEKWALDVRSMLPVDLSLKLKRRLHRATTVFNFAKFNSVDEAIKFAIAYVTDWPEGNLSASINEGINSRHEQLGARIAARYVHHEKTSMSAYLNPIKDSIIVSEPNNISKIN